MVLSFPLQLAFPGWSIFVIFLSSLIFANKASGQYYKHITIVNDDSSVIIKGHSSLMDDAIVIIYDHNMFIILATGGDQLMGAPLCFGKY
jgi:hypothetical protein